MHEIISEVYFYTLYVMAFDKSHSLTRALHIIRTLIFVLAYCGLDMRHVHEHLATHLLVPTYHTKKQLKTKVFTIHTSQEYNVYRH